MTRLNHVPLKQYSVIHVWGVLAKSANVANKDVSTVTHSRREYAEPTVELVIELPPDLVAHLLEITWPERVKLVDGYKYTEVKRDKRKKKAV